MISQKSPYKPKQDRYEKTYKDNLLLRQSSYLTSSLDTTATVNQQPAPEVNECRICLSSKDPSGSQELYSPCKCTGSVKYMHKKCFLQWMNRMYERKNPQDKAKMLLNGTQCEICKFNMPIKSACETRCGTAEQIRSKIKRKPTLFGVFTTMLALSISVIIYVVRMMLELDLQFDSINLANSLIMICSLVVLICVVICVGYFYVDDYFVFQKLVIHDFGMIPSSPNPQVVAQNNIQQYHIDNSVINLEN